MNNLNIAITIVFIFVLTGSLHAMDVYVAPFMYINEVDDIVDQQSDIHNDLYRELNKIETGIDLQFLLTRSRMNPPQSVLDAVRVCRDERIDFLLYGYIAKRVYNYFAEIRLYDYEMRAVINNFYAVDDHDGYQRMLEDMALKIINYIDDEFNLDIIHEEPTYYELWFPFDVGYWTAIGREWTDLLLGVAAVSAGIDFIPTDQLFIMFGKSFYPSLGINVGYRFGMGNKEVAYEAAYHVFTVKGRGRFHVNLHPQHSVYTGIGVSYSLDTLQAHEHYLEVKDRLYNTVGVEAELGYQFKISPASAFTFGNIIEWRFFEPEMMSYSARIGVKWMFYSREVVKKW